jgi:hypothetical protein
VKYPVLLINSSILTLQFKNYRLEIEVLSTELQSTADKTADNAAKINL